MNDLISRQAAIDAIADYLSKTTYTSAISFLNTGALILARVPSAQPEHRWIPCSERTPEENGRYLTTNSSWGYFEVDWNVWINGEWLYPNENPVAWMPLPEPWEGRGRCD